MKHITLNIGLLVAIAALLVAGCKPGPKSTGMEYAPQMYHSMPLEPFTQKADYKAPFKDGRNQQLPPEGTIAHDGWAVFDFENTPEDKVRAGVELMNPVAATPENLAEGKVLFERFCVVCHGKRGAGDGSIPKLSGKYPPPPKYGDKSVTDLPAGVVYHVMTYGQNSMGSYASQLDPTERWKVARYVETLQKGYVKPSEAPVNDMPAPAGDVENADGGDEHGEADNDGGEDHAEEHDGGEDHGGDEHN